MVMAIDKVRTRSRSPRHGAERRRPRRTAMSGGVDTSVVPRVVVDALNGVEIVVAGALRMTRSVLVRAISGAADISAQAVTATVAGVRGVMSAASRMIGDMAGAAQGIVAGTDGSASRPSRAGVARARRGRARRPRAATRSTRNSLAA